MKEHDLYKEIAENMVADLEQIEKRCEKNRRIVYMKKNRGMNKMHRQAGTPVMNKKVVGIIVAAACALVVGLPVMASGVAKIWDSTVANLFGIEEEVQGKYQDTNLTQLFEDNTEKDTQENQNITVAEQNGVTVTLTQTVADEYCMYVYVTVKTDGTIALTDEHIFDKTTLYVEGKEWNGFTSMGASFVSDSYATSENERNYEIIYLNAEEGIHLDNQRVELVFNNLMKDSGKQVYTAAEGNWKLEWTVEGAYSGERKTIDLKDTVVNGKDSGVYQLDTIDISPITYYLHYQNKGVDTFNEGELHVLFIMKDGTVYNKDNVQIGNGGISTEKGEFLVFDKMLDISQLKAVEINGTVYEYLTDGDTIS